MTKTSDECRQALYGHLAAMIDYWRDLPADRLSLPGSPPRSEAHERLEGLAFSILVALDGGAMTLPRFAVIPDPHPDDTDGWPADVDVADGVELHNEFSEFIEHRNRAHR